MRSVAVALRAEVAGYVAGMRRAKAETTGLVTELSKTKKGHKDLQVLGLASAAAGAAIGLGVGAAVRAFANFDAEMSNVKAATGEAAGGMDLLRAAAIKAGKDTKFSAGEAAQAETELAKAGVATADILGGALQGALDLASAGQLQVADAASIAATAMTQFGLAGKDVPHIADLLSAGANKAQGEVSDLGLALKYVGPVAHQMGVSIEETTGTIAELASNGILADQAGTGLRGMLSALTSPGMKAAGVMKELGINVYDASGNFVGFRGVADQLQKSLGGLDNATRDQALGQIFGNEQITAARILYSGGGQAVDDWTNKVNDSGNAARTAAIKMDNLKGDLEQLRGSIETALIGAGEGGNSALRGMTQGATGAVNAFVGLPGPVQSAGLAFAGVTSATLLTAGAVGTMIPKIQTARTALEGMGSAGQLASRGVGGLGKIGAVGAVAAATAVGMHALTIEINKLTHNTPADVDKLTNSIVHMTETGKVSGEVSRVLGDDLSHFSGGIGASTDGLKKFDTGLGLIPNRMDNLRSGVKSVDESLATLVNGGNLDTAATAFDMLAKSAVEHGHSIDEVRAALPKYANALTNVDTQQTLAGKSADGATKTLENLSDAEQAAADAADSAAKAVSKYKDELDALNGVNISAAQSQIALAQSVDDATKAIDKNHKKISRDELSALLDFASQANDTAEAIMTQTGSMEKSNAVLVTSRARFIKVAEQMGYTKAAAKKMADQFLAIPKATTTTVKTPGLPKAITNADLLQRKMDRLDGRHITTYFESVVYTTDYGTYRAGERSSPPPPKHAYGGFVGGAMSGGPKQDDVMVAASRGEFVVQNPYSGRYAGLLAWINSGRDPGGYAPARSTSMAPLTGPVTIVSPEPARAGRMLLQELDNRRWSSDRR